MKDHSSSKASIGEMEHTSRQKDAGPVPRGLPGTLASGGGAGGSGEAIPEGGRTKDVKEKNRQAQQRFRLRQKELIKVRRAAAAVMLLCVLLLWRVACTYVPMSMHICHICAVTCLTFMRCNMSVWPFLDCRI